MPSSRGPDRNAPSGGVRLFPLDWRVILAVLGIMVLSIALIAVLKYRGKSSRNSEQALQANKVVPIAALQKDIAQRLGRSNETIYVGFNPSLDLAKVRALGLQLTQEVSHRTGLLVRSVVGTSSADAAEGLSQGDYHGAFLSSVAYVKSGVGKSAWPILRFLRDGQYPDKYFSAFVVRKDSPIKSLKDLCGKKFGYADLDSASGYIYAKLSMLEYWDKNHLKNCDLTKERFLGGHKNVLQAVVSDEVDVGAVFASRLDGKSGAWTQLGAYPLRPIFYSEPIPSDAFVVSNSLSPDKRKRIADAFISYQKTPQGRDLFKQLLGTEGFVIASPHDFDNVVNALSRFKRMSEKYAKNHSPE